SQQGEEVGAGDGAEGDYQQDAADAQRDASAYRAGTGAPVFEVLTASAIFPLHMPLRGSEAVLFAELPKAGPRCPLHGGLALAPRSRHRHDLAAPAYDGPPE